MSVLTANTHRPGNHCASTALADLINFHDIKWSEAMVFGLGQGLGIWYVGMPNMPNMPRVSLSP